MEKPADRSIIADAWARRLREEIAALVEGELGDPRIGLVGVNEVANGADGKAGPGVRRCLPATDEEAAESIEGLNAAPAGYGGTS